MGRVVGVGDGACGTRGRRTHLTFGKGLIQIFLAPSFLPDGLQLEPAVQPAAAGPVLPAFPQSQSQYPTGPVHPHLHAAAEPHRCLPGEGHSSAGKRPPQLRGFPLHGGHPDALTSPLGILELSRSFSHPHLPSGIWLSPPLLSESSPHRGQISSLIHTLKPGVTLGWIPLSPICGSGNESHAKLGQLNQLRSRASPKFQLHLEVPAAEHPCFGEEKLSLGFGSRRKGEKVRTKLLPSLPERPGITSCPWECSPGGLGSHLTPGNAFLGGLIPVSPGAAGMGCAAAAPWGCCLAVANPEAKSRQVELSFPSFGIKGIVLWLLCGLCVQGGAPGDIRCLLSPLVTPGDRSCASHPAPRAGQHSLKSIL